MLIKKSILRSLGDQSWGFQVSCEATASEYWELSEQDGPFLLWSVCAWRWGLSQLKPVSWHIWVTEAWENLNCKVLRHFILEVWTEHYSWLFFFVFFLNGTETEMRQPSLTVAFCNTCTVLSIIHDVFSLTVPWTMRSTPVCLFQKEPCGMREHVPEVHTLKKACSHLVLEKIKCRRLCGSHWRWKKFIWLINSWSISSVKLYATPEFPVLSRNQASRLPLR